MSTFYRVFVAQSASLIFPSLRDSTCLRCNFLNRYVTYEKIHIHMFQVFFH